MQKESDYLVSNPKLIAEHLTDLFKKKCILSAQFGENNASFLTAIIELDVKNSLLKLDCGPTEPLTNQLLKSEKVLFRTELDGIKVSFKGIDITRTISDDQPVLQMPIPAALFWMQRREFYRVKVPLSHVGSYCEMVFQTRHANGGMITRRARFQISDISVCGFSLLNPDAEYNSHFESNEFTGQCTLYLHDAAHSPAGFVIKYVTDIRANLNATQQRIGCLFTGLPPAFESSILRYMQDIERLTKNIASG